MFGALRRAAPPAARRGRARRARPLRDLHAVARPGGRGAGRSGAARADAATRRSCGRRSCTAWSTPRRGTSRSGTSGSGSSRSRASTSRTATSSRTSSCTSAASSRAASRRVKGVVETLYAALKVELRIERDARPFLYPGRAARVGEGWLGELHPTASRERGASSSSTSKRCSRRSREPIQYEDVITYPAVKQDLAFAVDEEVAAGDLVAAAREAAGPELRELRVFDVYRGEQVGAGKKSIALRGGVPVAGADALRRGCGRDPRADRRRARRAVRRRAARLGSNPNPAEPSVQGAVMRLRGLIVLAVCAALVLVPAAIAQLPRRCSGRRPGLRDHAPARRTVARHAARSGHVQIAVATTSTEHNFHLQGPGVDQSTEVETSSTVTWTVTLRGRPLHIFCDPHSTQMRRDVRRRERRRRRRRRSRSPPKLLGDRRAEEHDRAEERQRRGAEDRQGRRRTRSRSRPLEAARLPPRRQGRQAQVGRRRDGHVDVEAEAEAGALRFFSRARKTIKGSVVAQVGSYTRRLGFTRPAFGPPAARISACRSSSEFSSAPKSSANAE